MIAQIENGVPIPPRYSIGDIRTFLKQLKPGQSFRLPDDMRQNVLLENARRSGIKITTRKVKMETDGWQGIRCWRVRKPYKPRNKQ